MISNSQKCFLFKHLHSVEKLDSFSYIFYVTFSVTMAIYMKYEKKIKAQTIKDFQLYINAKFSTA